MQQQTYFVSDMNELKETMEAVSACDAYRNARERLVVIYSNYMEKEEAQEYTTALKEQFPELRVAGISVVSSTETWDKRGLTLSFCFFEDSSIKVFEFNGSQYDEDSTAESLSTELHKIDNLKALMIFPSNIFRNTTLVLESLSSQFPELLIFGALAAAGFRRIAKGTVAMALDEAFESGDSMNEITPYCIGDEIHIDGFVAVAFSGTRLQIKEKYLLGWRPLGQELEITGRADDKFGNAIITEINHEPAVSIYKKYLQVEADKFFMINIGEFPLTIQREGATIARAPLAYGDSGELYFTGNIREDESIRLAYANPNEMLREVRKTSFELKRFAPEGLFIIVCLSRYQLLRDKELEELSYFRNVCPSMSFGYGGYEILKLNKRGGILNSALVAVSMKESDTIKENESADIEEERNKYMSDGVIPIYNRLLAFIEASTNGLEEALEEAKQANRSKSIFLSNMSHEIRTPINAILGMDEMILRETNDPAIRKYAEDIRSASLSLLGIVNEILDFSKIEAGKLSIVPVEYESASVLNDLSNMIRKRVEEKGLEMVSLIDPNIPTLLYGDELRLKQIVTNILSNAVKYTKEGRITSEVKVRQSEKGEEYIILCIRISDTGIGIKKEDLPKLFDAFERIEEKRNRTIEGTGLGMTITRNLLHMMGSELNVESEYGVGTTFWFELEQKVIDPQPIGSFQQALERSLAQRKKYHESFIAPKAHILVVDDTEINLSVIKGLLKRTLIDIDTALSGMECIQKVTENDYDIIFLDHRMPNMDGVETLEKIKADKLLEGKEVPVIALTANAISGSREYYLRHGFDDYISKPVDPVALEAMILRYLEKKGLAVIHEQMPEDSTTEAMEAERKKQYSTIPEINVDYGIEKCGSLEGYENAVKLYLDSSKDMETSIKTYYREGDIENFTIKVHALKSSSRIIGAIEMSALAEELEQAGNSNDIKMIDAMTPILLSKYQNLVVELRDVIPEENGPKDYSREVIDIKKLQEAYQTINEISQMYDYDSVQMVMASLEDYQIPSGEQERYSALKEAVRKADWDEIIRLTRE